MKHKGSDGTGAEPQDEEDEEEEGDEAEGDEAEEVEAGFGLFVFSGRRSTCVGRWGGLS